MNNNRSRSTASRGGSSNRTSGNRSSRFSNSRSGGGRRGSSFRSGRPNRGGRGGGRRGGGRKMPTFNPSQFVNQNPVEVKEEVYENKHTFADFGLSIGLLRKLETMGIETPSPIQDQIIPEILKGNDVIGLAETGTGKTAAFLLPVIEKTLADTNRKTLILTPTRELAIQINDEFMKLSKGLKLFSTTCVGGVNIRPQIRSLQRTNHFIIGTPGRVLDLIKRKNLETNDITTVVLDEADRMLDMGFINDMKQILSSTPKDRETLFFSATMDDKTSSIVNDFMKNPVTISVKKKDVTNSIEQDIVPHKGTDKFELLKNMFSLDEFKRVIIFGETKHGVEDLSKQLVRAGIKAESIHGNKNHGQRQFALNKFKSGNARVLVATDVAARGIHVDNVSHVINYEMPQTFTDYVHRIGRTGRGDKKGKALTFVPERLQRKQGQGRRY
jgi:superfamily II DNA/RNA helicase